MGTFKVEGDINITGAKTNINYGTPQYCSNQTNIKATTGLNICQGNDETSGIQLNGDYITMWSPADSYCLRYYDEDSGNEIWNINSNGLFSGKVSWDNISSKPSTFTPSSHAHDYLPTSGGTLSGSLNIGGKVELWSDTEGGNIRLTSPNGSLWSIDALGNTSMRFIWAESSVPFTFTKDGTINATYFSGTANYANSAGYATTADETSVNRGGGSIPWAGSFDFEPDVTAYRSMFATYMDSSSTWWNLISNRHRNGSSDGYNYGMYIKCRLTGSWQHLLWNRQYGGSWQGERYIHDTGNVCISSSNPGNGSFYGQIWFKI